MGSKQISKKLSRSLAWLGLVICSLIIKLVPRPCLYGFANNLAYLGYLLASKQRNIALDSLRVAFGKEMSEAQIRQIARDCFTFMAKAGTELLFLMDRPQLLKQRVGLVNREYLDSALSRGKGVVLVSAHFGSFPLLLAKLSFEGYKTAGIMRFMRDERVERIFMAKRMRLGIQTIYSQPRRACVEDSIRALRKNGVLFIPIDQNFGSGGVFVDFFGRKAATATGPVVLAQRTGAAIIPCFIVRQKDDTHKIIFEPVMEVKGAGGSGDALVDTIQKLTGIIESYIRRYPAEWGWIHRRWKSKPAAG